MNARPVRVLVVEDSMVVRMLLVHLFEEAPGISVAGAVDGGQAALDFLREKTVDVVLLDIHMEGMDGYETARRIMESRPVPVVMCSALTDPRAVATAFRAYEAGAVAVVEKPVSPAHPEFRRLADELLQTVRLMSEVKVVRRWPRHRQQAKRQPVRPASRGNGTRIVGIGASTGGPPALQAVLGGLDRDFPAPVLVVQHITAGFLPGLIEWLGQTTGLQVQVAANGMEPRGGHVYLAPDDYHLGIDHNGLLELNKAPADNGLRPSVDHLFHSLARHCGQGAIGVLLTGMGRDGAEGLRAMRDQGALTVVQDRATSVIHGMPGAAIGLDAAIEVLPVERIADALIRAVKPSSTPESRAI